jgi:predicted SprT family Zn-dependent metalloprotease
MSGLTRDGRGAVRIGSRIVPQVNPAQAAEVARHRWLADVTAQARALLALHGLDVLGWRFRYDGARVRAGCCKHRPKLITLSRHYVELNQERPGDVTDTILHEIAHALAGPGMGHGDAWKAVCVRIGARPKRCYDSDAVTMPKGAYQATCGGCARAYNKHKRPRRSGYYCPRCGPTLGTLTFVRRDDC